MSLHMPRQLTPHRPAAFLFAVPRTMQAHRVEGRTQLICNRERESWLLIMPEGEGEPEEAAVMLVDPDRAHAALRRREDDVVFLPHLHPEGARRIVAITEILVAETYRPPAGWRPGMDGFDPHQIRRVFAATTAEASWR